MNHLLSRSLAPFPSPSLSLALFLSFSFSFSLSLSLSLSPSLSLFGLFPYPPYPRNKRKGRNVAPDFLEQSSTCFCARLDAVPFEKLPAAKQQYDWACFKVTHVVTDAPPESLVYSCGVYRSVAEDHSSSAGIFEPDFHGCRTRLFQPRTRSCFSEFITRSSFVACGTSCSACSRRSCWRQRSSWRPQVSSELAEFMRLEKLCI